jgi:hypothetical protein
VSTPSVKLALVLELLTLKSFNLILFSNLVKFKTNISMVMTKVVTNYWSKVLAQNYTKFQCKLSSSHSMHHNVWWCKKQEVKTLPRVLLVHFVVFVLACIHLQIIVFTFILALYLVIYSICCLFIFISSLCTRGLLVVIHSSSHRHFNIRNFSLHLVVYVQLHRSLLKFCVWYSQFGWKNLFALFNS